MTKKILTGIACLLAAFALWLYVVTVVSPEWEETFRDVPVTFVGETVLLEERGLKCINKGTTTVSLQLSGNRSDLSKLSNSNITVTVDLAKVYEADTTELPYSISYPGNVPQSAVTVLNRNPSGIQVEIVRWDTVELELTPDDMIYLGTPFDGYIKDTAQIENPRISIAGPKDVVSRIAKARVQIDVEGANATFTKEYGYTLYDDDGMPIENAYLEMPATVTVTQPILKLKELPLRVDVIYGGGATESNTTITMEYNTILVAGKEEDLADLEELVLGQIDLNQLSGDTVLTFPVELEGISNETGITEVKVTVDMPPLVTKTVKVTQITAANVPEDLTADITTQEIDVVLRGTQQEIDGLSADDLTAVVDFTGKTAGTDRFVAQITIADRFPNVGVVGTYTVLATLEKAD